MQIIGFNFTKISAEKIEEMQKPNISTNIEFINIEKEKIDFLKDSEAFKVSFKYGLDYENREEKKILKNGEIKFEGRIILSTNKEESKKILKSWKKKEIPNEIKVPLFNLILKKCTPKAVYLQDEINLPSHVPMPRISPKQQD